MKSRPSNHITNIDMKNYPVQYVILLLFLGLLACEEEFVPPAVQFNNDIVVEGYIEAYNTDCENCVPPSPARPVYVILTRSLPVHEAFGEEDFEELFVRNAKVSISFGQENIPLSDICLNDLDDATRQSMVERLGLNTSDLSLLGLDFNETNFCAYIDLVPRTFEAGLQYDLSIEIDTQRITASTTIPEPIPLDSIGFRVPPGDSLFFRQLRQMLIYLDTPDSTINYFRYFTQRNDEKMYKGNFSLSGFRSVLDDEIFSNYSSGLPLQRGEPRDSSFNTGGNLFGNYRQNDDYLLKWCTIDENHFNFWNSSEFNALNQGLFSTYTQTQSNINGGIGIWGGYSVSLYAGKVPRR